MPIKGSEPIGERPDFSFIEQPVCFTKQSLYFLFRRNSINIQEISIVRLRNSVTVINHNPVPWVKFVVFYIKPVLGYAIEKVKIIVRPHIIPHIKK